MTMRLFCLLMDHRLIALAILLVLIDFREWIAIRRMLMEAS